MKQDEIFQYEDVTLNTVTGCEKISPGCAHCYAETIAKRLRQQGNKRYTNGFKITVHHDVMDKFYEKKRRSRISKLYFANSMADLFEERVTLDHIQKVFKVIGRLPFQRFKILTKRSERLLELDPQLNWPSNLIMGVSIENNDYKYRMDHLKKCRAHWKSLSLEPLLGPVTDLNLNGIDWVVVGGESGTKARPMKEEWVRDIRDECLRQNVPFAFKQWSSVKRRKKQNLLDGQIWIQVPQEFVRGVEIKIAPKVRKYLAMGHPMKKQKSNIEIATLLPVINSNSPVSTNGSVQITSGNTNDVSLVSTIVETKGEKIEGESKCAA